MEVTIETITPKMASEYLTRNTRNRRLKKALVEQYASEMRAGNWRLTHQGVAFNCDGTLLDGQHRLAGIVKSECAIQMLVARGVDSKSQIVMDDHAKRSAGDAITLVRQEVVTDKDVAIIRGCVDLTGNWKRGQAFIEAEHRRTARYI